MSKKSVKKLFQRAIVILATAFCLVVFCNTTISTYANDEQVYFDILDDATFDNSNANLTYNTATKQGVIGAATTPWIDRNFSFTQYENVITPNGDEVPFNSCTAEFSVTFSNVGTLESKVNILGVKLINESDDVVYRMQGAIQQGYSSWLALGDDLDSPFVNESQKGDYRFGTSLLVSTTTVRIRITPATLDANGEIVFYVNENYMGTLVYESTSHLNIGLVAQNNTANISNASYKVYGATGWAVPPPPPSHQVFNGTQTNDVFGYDAKNNTAYLPPSTRNYTSSFGKLPLFESLTLSNGTTIKPSQATWEYKSTLYDFEFLQGALDYYGIGLSVMTNKGTSLDMRIMYDGRLFISVVPSSSAADFGLSASGRIIDIPNFSPKTNPQDRTAQISLKFKVNRASGEIEYFVDDKQFGSLTYYGKESLNSFGLHSWWSGGKYKDISLSMLDVVDVSYRDYFSEEYVSTNQYDKPQALPNLNIKPYTDNSGPSKNVGVIIGCVCGGVAFAGATCAVVIILLKKSKKQKKQE